MDAEFKYYHEGVTPNYRNLLGGRATTSAERAYQQYVNDLSYIRVRTLPTEVLARTSIEERIESRLRMMLNTVVPPMIIRQCDDRDDVSCAQILYRTMVFAGPASKDDCMHMMDILIAPRVVELNKLYDTTIQFRFAKNRLRKYGHREPEPSQLFETLKVASSALSEKDLELQFRFQHY